MNRQYTQQTVRGLLPLSVSFSVPLFRLRVTRLRVCPTTMQGAGLEGTVGAKYTGALDFNGKWAGEGTLSYPNGVSFRGHFLDGQFHGPGELVFPNGAVYKSTWNEGREVDKHSSYQWADGLPFNLYQEWPYLEGFDRRMWPELRVAPDGRPSGHIHHPSRKVHAQTEASFTPVANIADEDIHRAVTGMVSPPRLALALPLPAAATGTAPAKR